MSESEKALCDNVEEGDIERSIVEGPPAAGCREDSERYNDISIPSIPTIQKDGRRHTVGLVELHVPS